MLRYVTFDMDIGLAEKLISAEVIHFGIGSCNENGPLFIVGALVSQGSIHGPVVIQGEVKGLCPFNSRRIRGKKVTVYKQTLWIRRIACMSSSSLLMTFLPHWPLALHNFHIPPPNLYHQGDIHYYLETEPSYHHYLIYVKLITAIQLYIFIRHSLATFLIYIYYHAFLQFVTKSKDLCHSTNIYTVYEGGKLELSSISPVHIS